MCHGHVRAEPNGLLLRQMECRTPQSPKRLKTLSKAVFPFYWEGGGVVFALTLSL